MGRDYLMEQAEYLKKDLGKHNISQTLFQRLKELIIEGKLPAGYMMPNENIVSEMLGWAEALCGKPIQHWQFSALSAAQRQVHSSMKSIISSTLRLLASRWKIPT